VNLLRWHTREDAHALTGSALLFLRAELPWVGRKSHPCQERLRRKLLKLGKLMDRLQFFFP